MTYILQENYHLDDIYFFEHVFFCFPLFVIVLESMFLGSEISVLSIGSVGLVLIGTILSLMTLHIVEASYTMEDLHLLFTSTTAIIFFTSCAGVVLLPR